MLLDSALFSQAILNIVKNALEAAESGLQRQPTRPAQVLLKLVPQPQGWQLSVTDSGDLLREVEGGQLFTPFFTTKKVGQGIGLVFVREVLQRHGLPYRLASTDDQQSCFDIWFSGIKS